MNSVVQGYDATRWFQLDTQGSETIVVKPGPMEVLIVLLF